MNITVKNVLVEAHYLIEMIERYHESLRRIYTIIIVEISDITLDLVLQMTFKAINDSVDSNKLVSTLIVFDVYSRMSDLDASSSTITQRAVTMRKIMKEIRKSMTTKQVNNALNTRNELSTETIHDLSINLVVLVFREKNTSQLRS
jgi:hypothetical protein